MRKMENSRLLQCKDAIRLYVAWFVLEELTTNRAQSVEATELVQPAIVAVAGDRLRGTRKRSLWYSDVSRSSRSARINGVLRYELK
jgi:hypothetical protein